MGGAVSAGEDNDELVDNLVDSEYIKSTLVESIMRAVDRGDYYEGRVDHAYRDMAWRSGNLHISAPCIYSEVLEGLDLKPGMSFLNLGSGTGYLSTMVGLVLGPNGVNHGVEFYQDVVDYARKKLAEFKAMSAAPFRFGFAEPEFVTGNLLCIDANATDQNGDPRRYDRIYCGASVSPEFEPFLRSLLKIGGILVMPVGDTLVQITRRDHEKFERRSLLSVSFANLLEPMPSDPPVRLPDLRPHPLRTLATVCIQNQLRQCIKAEQPELLAPISAKERQAHKRRTRRSAKRKALRLARYVRMKEAERNGAEGNMNPIDELEQLSAELSGHSEMDSDSDQDESDTEPDDEADPMSRPLRRLHVKIQRTASALQRLVQHAATGMNNPVSPPPAEPMIAGSVSENPPNLISSSSSSSNAVDSRSSSSSDSSDANPSPTPSSSGGPIEPDRRPSTSSGASSSGHQGPEISVILPSPIDADEETSESNDEEDDQPPESARNKRSISLQSEAELNVEMALPGSGPVAATVNRVRGESVIKRMGLGRKMQQALRPRLNLVHHLDSESDSDQEYQDCSDRFPKPEDPFVTEMKRRIRLLPLPTTLKILINYNRDLD